MPVTWHGCLCQEYWNKKRKKWKNHRPNTTTYVWWHDPCQPPWRMHVFFKKIDAWHGRPCWLKRPMSGLRREFLFFGFSYLVAPTSHLNTFYHPINQIQVRIMSHSLNLTPISSSPTSLYQQNLNSIEIPTQSSHLYHPIHSNSKTAFTKPSPFSNLYKIPGSFFF